MCQNHKRSILGEASFETLHIPAPLVELNVSSSLESVFNFNARKKRNPANFVPQIVTDAADSVILEQVEESKEGIDATANDPVPIRSRCKCEPVNTEMRNPNAFNATYMTLDCRSGTLLNTVGSGTADNFDVGYTDPPRNVSGLPVWKMSTLSCSSVLLWIAALLTFLGRNALVLLHKSRQQNMDTSFVFMI